MPNSFSTQHSTFSIVRSSAVAGRKPNSVPALTPCGATTDDNHSSSPAITGGIQRPTRRLRTGSPITPPYLALLRAGFCLPPVLPRARCALTAPFHPYPPPRRRREGGRYIFCATFLQVALTGRYPAHCPAEFGLSSPPPPPLRAAARQVPFGTNHADGRQTPCGACRTEAHRGARRQGGDRLASCGGTPIIRRFPARCRTVRASCTDCCAGCRSPRPSWRCSSRSRAACQPGTPARTSP